MSRIAWFSPFPPLTSGIAHYAAALLPRVARRHEVVVYRDPKYIPEVGFAAPEIEPAEAFAGREDLAVYHVGADWRSMAFLWEPLHRRPGLVVLHDFSLHDLAAGAFRGRPGAFLSYFLRHEGREGLDRLTRDAAGRRRLSPLAWSERIRFAEDRRERFPLNRGILRRARGVVVHSLWSARAVRRIAPEARVFLVPHGATPTLTDESPRQARAVLQLERIGATPETFLVTLYGSLGGHKRIAQALGGVRLFLRKNKDVDLRVILAGKPTPEVDLATLVSTLGLSSRVHVAERTRPLREVHRLLRASNAYIGLRDPGLGATSGA
ncbi:MAG: hypothetical protein K8I02_05890, partial [Candidatus Methylomirabilis sp.]|nr:hypothetical protein [Deltaproteobacteria bacterium]